MDQPIRVKILDHEYLIRSDEDESEVQRVAEFVDKRFREIKNNARGLSDTKTAILAAFHIAGEYFQALKGQEDIKNDIQARSKKLNNKINTITGHKIHARDPKKGQ